MHSAITLPLPAVTAPIICPTCRQMRRQRVPDDATDGNFALMWAVALLATVAGMVAYHAMMATGFLSWLG